MQLSNYLFFTTMCEPALAFYTECGIGSVVRMVRYGENGMHVRTPSMRGKIMHSEFAGPGVHFFASDNDDAEPMRGSAMIFMLASREQTDRLFARLGDGGQITTPLGVQWMFNCTGSA